MLKIGIVGLPNAGKSTLFNALVSKPKAGVAQHPFTTIDKNMGVVAMPDQILFDLAKLENIAKVTPATIEFVDIAGLIKGAHLGEGLGNQFLHYVREVDLILHVVRFFKDESVPHVHSQVDPEEDVGIINEELLFADLESLRRKIEKEKTTEEEKKFIRKLIEELNKGTPASQIIVDDKEREFIKTLNLLTLKKQLLVANIGEEDVNQPPKELDGKPLLSICAKLEAELCELPWVQQQQFLKDYQLEKTAKQHIVLESYKALDIITFYTIAKRQEAKAWTIGKSAHAVAAAAKIHTDFAKHFVKVEAINASELIKFGGWHKAHTAGKVLIHGRDYLVQNQDVLEFKVGLKSA